MSVKLIVVALLATAATVATAAPKNALTVKTCASATCECTGAGEVKKYVEGSCVKEEANDKHWRLDTCTAGHDATLTSFANEKDCKNPDTVTVSKDCTPAQHMIVNCDTPDTIKLYISCPSDCSDLSKCGTSIDFTTGDDCKEYKTGKYLKATDFTCEGDFEIHDSSSCDSSTETLAKPKDCTPSTYEKGVCNSPGAQTATVKTCSDECTTCEDMEFNLNQYTSHNEKYYFIKECTADSDLEFKVLSAQPETQTVPHECKAASGSDYTMGTCAEEGASNPDQGGAPMKLSVQKDCATNQCDVSSCPVKKYVASGDCAPLEGDAQKHYKATCGETKTLKIFADMDACTKGTSPQDVALPDGDTCVADSTDKFHKATCSADDEDNHQPAAQELVVLKECSNNMCDASTCKSEKYPLNECSMKNSKAYKAACGPDGAASLKEFADKATCEGGSSAGTDVPLPTKDCAADSNSKFQKVVCPKGGPDNMPAGGGYDGPIITVNTSCTDGLCKTCPQEKTVVFKANGSCFEQPQESGSKYYTADCATLTVKTYTDKKCKEGEQVTTYKETCDTANKRIAGCVQPESTTTTVASSAPAGDSPNGPDGNSPNGPDGNSPNGADGNSSNDTNTSDGLSVSPVHATGGLALVLLMVALVC